MFECLILGDSIAAGLSLVKPNCKAVVRSGTNSRSWLEQFQYNPFYRETLFKVAVISLGTNDMYNTDTEFYLRMMRRGVRANMVIWILPSAILKPEQHDIVKKIAIEYGDKTLDIRTEVGHDGTHPHSLLSYKKIADNIINPE